MKLKAQIYNSPLLTEGTFTDVFIEETAFKIEKGRKYMIISFEMYYYKNNEKTVLDTRDIAFYGAAGDIVTSNKLAVIAVPNEEYESQVVAIPLTIEVPNPEYNSEMFITEPNPDYSPEIEGSEEFLTFVNSAYNITVPEFITIDNPNYSSQVATIPRMISVPFLQYLSTHEGNLPEVYEVIDWGYPNYEDALRYFEGGDRFSHDITITNPFAREWLKNTLVMKNEKIGVQFNFED